MKTLYLVGGGTPSNLRKEVRGGLGNISEKEVCDG